MRLFSTIPQRSQSNIPFFKGTVLEDGVTDSGASLAVRIEGGSGKED